MYFYPKFITENAVQSLQEVGLELKNGEIVIPDSECQTIRNGEIILRGIHLTKRQITFNGHMDPPKTFSTLHGGMVYSGRDMNQCHICGYWLSDKPSLSDEKQHEQQCRPQYRWELA